MPNICLKSCYWEKVSYSKLRFSKLTKFVSTSGLGSSNWRIEFSNSFSNLKTKTVCGFSIVFILKGIMTFKSQMVHVFCWTKIIKFSKNETELKTNHTYITYTNHYFINFCCSFLKSEKTMSLSLGHIQNKWLIQAYSEQLAYLDSFRHYTRASHAHSEPY